MGLTKLFNRVRGQILLMCPLPSINVVLSMVTQDDKQREVTTTMPHTKTPMKCVVQNNSKNFKKERPTCANCGVIVHFKEKCFKLHGYPPRYKKTQAYNPTPQSNNVYDHGNTSYESVPDMTIMTSQSF